MKTNNAFTLIEVLIALLIIAIALAAVTRATNQSVQSTIHVRDTIAAHWVAMNVLSELQTGLLTFPQRNNDLQGKTEMLQKVWHWSVQLTGGLQPRYVQRVTITVFYRNHLITSLTGFVPNATP